MKLTENELKLRELLGEIYARGAEDLIHHRLNFSDTINEFMPKIKEVVK